MAMREIDVTEPNKVHAASLLKGTIVIDSNGNPLMIVYVLNDSRPKVLSLNDQVPYIEDVSEMDDKFVSLLPPGEKITIEFFNK